MPKTKNILKLVIRKSRPSERRNCPTTKKSQYSSITWYYRKIGGPDVISSFLTLKKAVSKTPQAYIPYLLLKQKTSIISFASNLPSHFRHTFLRLSVRRHPGQEYGGLVGGNCYRKHSSISANRKNRYNMFDTFHHNHPSQSRMWPLASPRQLRSVETAKDRG